MGKVRADVVHVSKPGDRWSAKRKIHSANPKAVAAHNKRVGEVLHAYNTAQASFYQLFLTVAGDGNSRLAIDLWNSHGSDYSRRNLLRIFTNNTVQRRLICKSILWSISAMDKLSEHRNDAVHADMIWYYDQMAPGWLASEKRRIRMESAPLEKTWLKLRGDFAVISNYVLDLNLTLWSNESRPLSKRPKLRLT